jgi:hypothetical protein
MEPRYIKQAISLHFPLFLEAYYSRGFISLFRVAPTLEHRAFVKRFVSLQILNPTKELTCLIGRRSNLSLDNKVLLYKTIIKPIWVYGIELWGCASKSNISIIQRRQSKILRKRTNEPWYVNNQTIHTDLNIPYINYVIKEKSTIHHNKLARHSNDILQPLVEPQQSQSQSHNATDSQSVGLSWCRNPFEAYDQNLFI